MNDLDDIFVLSRTVNEHNEYSMEPQKLNYKQDLFLSDTLAVVQPYSLYQGIQTGSHQDQIISQPVTN